MHEHEADDNNTNGGHDSKMMWLMMLACLLPVLLVGFVGSGNERGLVWPLVIIGGMLALHWFAMRHHGRGHNHGHGSGCHMSGHNQPPEANQPTVSSVPETDIHNHTKA